jgi:hypothetical protein
VRIIEGDAAQPPVWFPRNSSKKGIGHEYAGIMRNDRAGLSRKLTRQYGAGASINEHREFHEPGEGAARGSVAWMKHVRMLSARRIRLPCILPVDTQSSP